MGSHYAASDIISTSVTSHLAALLCSVACPSSGRRQRPQHTTSSTTSASPTLGTRPPPTRGSGPASTGPQGTGTCLTFATRNCRLGGGCLWTRGCRTASHGFDSDRLVVHGLWDMQAQPSGQRLVAKHIASHQRPVWSKRILTS